MQTTTEEFTDTTPIPFGKFMGKRLIDIPAHYLLWLFNKGCDHPQLRRYLIDNLEALKKEAGEAKKYG